MKLVRNRVITGYESTICLQEKRIEYLKEELKAAKEEIKQMVCKKEAIREEVVSDVIDILKTPISELTKNYTPFSVYSNKDNNEDLDGECEVWTLYTRICCLGGCDYDGIDFTDRDRALIAREVYTLAHKKPDISYACTPCYSEYIQNCI